MLTKSVKAAIITHAQEEYPREACGVIVNGEYVPCTNISPDNAQFEIDPMNIVGASKEGEIKAYVHSHPDGSCQPSMPDRVQMNLHGLPWIITNGTDVELHKPDGYKAPLLGREYYHGIMDCYTLIQDYYQRELGITLNNYERTDAWWEDKDLSLIHI